MTEVKPDSAQTRLLLEQVARGDRQALERLLQQYRPRLHAFIEARLGPWATGVTRAAIAALSVRLGSASPQGWLCHIPTKVVSLPLRSR